MANVRPIRSGEDYDAALARASHLMDVLSPPEGQIDDLDHPPGPNSTYLLPSSRCTRQTLPDGIPRSRCRDRAPYGRAWADAARPNTFHRKPRQGVRGALRQAGHHHVDGAGALPASRIPADVLLGEREVFLDDTLADVEWRRFPLRAMAKLGWVSDEPGLMDRAEEVMRGMIRRAGGPKLGAASLFRKNDHRRISAKTDEYGLSAWCWEVLGRANDRPPEAPYRLGTVTPGLLRAVAQSSRLEDGPRLAVKLLAQCGIAVQVVPHLPRTHLDGAALALATAAR